MEGVVALRLLKFFGVAVFCAGVLGAVALPSQRDRRRSAHVAATLGLAAVWIGGWGLLKHLGLSMAEPWIARALLAGLLSLAAAVWATHGARRAPLAGALACSALLAAFGLMSAREASAVFGLVVPAIAGALAFVLLGRGATAEPVPPDPDPQYREASGRWFLWIARAEGASLLVLLGVYMPLKYGASIVLDGGQGWFGWIHGVLQLLFLVALSSVARVHRLPRLYVPLAVLASVLPLGTFVLERYLVRGGHLGDQPGPGHKAAAQK